MCVTLLVDLWHNDGGDHQESSWLQQTFLTMCQHRDDPLVQVSLHSDSKSFW